MPADQPIAAPTATVVALRDSPGLSAPRGHYSHVAVHRDVAYISWQLLLDPDIAQWPAVDAAYAQWLGAHRPSRAVACVTDLHYGAAIEVQAVAAVGPCA